MVLPVCYLRQVGILVVDDRWIPERGRAVWSPPHHMYYLRKDNATAEKHKNVLCSSVSFLWWKRSLSADRNTMVSEMPHLTCSLVRRFIYHHRYSNSFLLISILCWTFFKVTWTYRLDTENVSVSSGAPSVLEKTKGVCKGKVTRAI